jgi:hypothetical protein
MPDDPQSARLGLSRAAEPWWAEQTYARLSRDPAPLTMPPVPVPAGQALYEAGVGDILAGFASGGLTPSGLIAHLRDRMQSQDPERKYLWSLIDADTSAADDRWARGTARPLEGVRFCREIHHRR